MMHQLQFRLFTWYMALLWRSTCGLSSALASTGSPVMAWYLRMIQAIPPRLSLLPCWLTNTASLS